MEQVQENPQQTQAVSDDGTASWAAAAQPSQPPAPQPDAQPSAPSPAQPGGAQPAIPQPSQEERDSVQTESPNVQTQLKYIPMPLRPVNTGLRGVIDKIGDVLAGTTRPELYQDDQGNKYVMHQQMSHGAQWLKIGAEMVHGAAAGLAAGRGHGAGAAALAGWQSGQEDKDRDKADERQMNADARQSMLDKANAQMMRMQLAEQAWRLARLQPEADEKSAAAATQQGQHYAELKGVKVGTMAHAGDLSNILHTTPNLAEQFVQKGTINLVPHYERGVDGNMHMKGVEVWKMPDGWRNEMLPAKTSFDWFNPQTGEIEQHQASDPMTAGEQSDYHVTAANAQLKWKADQAETKLKGSQAKNLDSEATNRDQNAPLDRELKKAEAAKNWAEAHKANMEAQNQQPEAEDTESQAIALVERRTAPSLLNKRAKNYNAIMHRADQISVERFGHPLDQQEVEQGYQSRMKLVKDYTDGAAAGNIESFDKFLGHALAASQAVNGLRNTNSPWLNKPINELSKLSGSDRSPAIKAFMVQLDTLRKEFETTLKNNHALTDQDVKAGLKLLDDGMSPSQLQDVMREMGHISARRLQATDFKYMRTMGHHVPDLISSEGSESLRHFGIDPQAVYSNRADQGAQQQGQKQLPGQGKVVSLAAARSLPQYKGMDDAHITAAAEQLGYQVTQ